MKSRIKAQETVTIPREEYEELKASVTLLQQQIKLMNKKLFGSKSEKSEYIDSVQLSIFAEKRETEIPESKDISVSGHTRKKKAGTIEGIVPANIPVEITEYKLSPEDLICDCGCIMKEIGAEVRKTLVIVPAQVKIREERYYSYTCEKCSKPPRQAKIIKVPKEPTVIAGSFASPQAIAHIMVQKFVMGSPLYRQEQEFNRKKINLSRQTMSNWLIRASEDWLEPICNNLQKELLKQEVIHADETTLQVLQEEGKAAQSKSYIWLYRTGSHTYNPIVLYDYKPDRKADNPQEYLKGFKGYLQTDGYSSYHNLGEDIQVVGCFAHARRYFDEALVAMSKEKREGSVAWEGLQLCNRLFEIERECAELTCEERQKYRQEKAKPVLDEILLWAESQNFSPKSKTGKALTYLLNQWKYLIRYIEDGRLEISNNRAERSIKPFVIARKNFLFSNSVSGAKATAVIFSIIETAKENGLDPYQYLLWIFKEAPKLFETDRNWSEKLLPHLAPDECRI